LVSVISPTAAAQRPLFLLEWRLKRLLKKLDLALILGGAAVHRCDNWLVFIDGFSR